MKNLTGEQFGRLTVIELTEKRRDIYWRCRCNCGVEKTVSSGNLVSGRTNSCGCLNRELLGNRAEHGHARLGIISPTWWSWQSMRVRCLNKADRNYPEYGASGVTICAAWENDFAAFLKYMGERPDGTTLDRYPNKSGNYEPGNCRWATPKQQARNTRRNKLVTIDDETLSVAEWSEISGVKQMTIGARLRAGWSPRIAVFTEVKNVAN